MTKSSNNKNQKVNFKIGQAVKVKKGVMCPDYDGLCLEDYQGRIVDIVPNPNDETFICIEWDSISLKSLPAEYITESLEEGLDYQMMYLSPEEIELTEERDKEDDVNSIQDEIHEHYKWSGSNGEEEIIKSILNGLENSDDKAKFDAWHEYLKKNITFPFDAKISAQPERGSLKLGDKVKVENIAFIDEEYGVVVEVKKNRNSYYIPLCDLQAFEKTSDEFVPISSYTIWFANQ